MTSRANLTYTKNRSELIKQAAQLIPSLPEKRQLDCALVLYRALPENLTQRVKGLEAIMAHTATVPESHDSFTVLNIMNTELFKIRLSLT